MYRTTSPPPQKRVLTLHNMLQMLFSALYAYAGMIGIPKQKNKINQWLHERLRQMQAQENKVSFQQKARVNADISLVNGRVYEYLN